MSTILFSNSVRTGSMRRERMKGVEERHLLSYSVESSQRIEEEKESDDNQVQV